MTNSGGGGAAAAAAAEGSPASAERDAQQAGMLGARALSQIQEDSREHSMCLLPLVTQQDSGAASPVVDEAKRQEVDPPDASPLEDNGSLLEELSRIEADLRTSVCLDMERQQEAEFLRQQGNRLMRTHLCYLSLSQRVAKPWVSSYFRRFPMHIYCLPVQAANHRARRRGMAKRK